MFKSLQRLCAQRQIRLMESMYRHEYFAESAELEQWIKELEQTASSEDYGQDYEHLLVSNLFLIPGGLRLHSKENRRFIFHHIKLNFESDEINLKLEAIGRV